MLKPLLVAIFSTIFVAAVTAQTIFVDASANGSNSGTDWVNAHPLLSTALATASSGIEIKVAEGTYTAGTSRGDTFDLPEGVTILGGYPAGGGNRNPDPLTNSTILSGEIGTTDLDDNSLHILTGSALSEATILDGFTIQHGYAQGNHALNENKGGGLILTNNSSPILRNLHFINNIAAGDSSAAEGSLDRNAYGGAVAFINSRPSLSQVTFTNNLAEGADSLDGTGGDAYGGALYAEDENITLAQANFYENSATAGSGGAGTDGSNGTKGASGQNGAGVVYSTDGSPGGDAGDATTGFSGGEALGGAIYLKSIPVASLSLCHFEANLASAGDGGVGGNGGDGGRGGSGGDGASGVDNNNASNGASGGASGEAGDGGPGGASYGGAFAGDSLSDTSFDLCSFQENMAVGGTGGNGGDGGKGGSGGHGGDATDLIAGGADGGNGGDGTDGKDGQDGGDRGSATGAALFISNSTVTLNGSSFLGNIALVGNGGDSGIPGTGGAGGNGGSGARQTLPSAVGGAGGDGGNGGNTGSSVISQGSGNGIAEGGAICVDNSNLAAIHCIFTGNAAHDPLLFGSGTAPTSGTTFSGGPGGAAGQGGSSGFGADDGPDGNSGSDGASDDAGETGTSPTIQGGALCLKESSCQLTNLTFASNNRVSTANQGSGADIFLSSNASLTLIKNCIFSGNTVSPADTLDQLDETSNGVDPLSSNNLIDDGTSPLSPLFTDPPNSGDGDWRTAADNIYGNLRLLNNSPAINTGDNAANTQAFDLDGNPRIAGGTIDLGPFEYYADFTAEFPTLDPNDDDNSNGISNFGDWAAGGNPTAPGNLSLHPQINGSELTFSTRNNSLSLTNVFQKSLTLQENSWSELIEGVDYTVTNSVDSGDQNIVTLELLTTDAILFFRQEFMEAP